MADKRWGRHTGKDATNTQHNIFRLNLDFRSGPPRATLVNPTKSYLNSVVSPSQGVSLAQQVAHPNHPTHYVPLDQPPKYDDIFKNPGSTQKAESCQDPRRYQKKRLKSYLLRHLPRARHHRGSVKAKVTQGSSAPQECYAQINIIPATPLQYQDTSPPETNHPHPELHHRHPNLHNPPPNLHHPPPDLHHPPPELHHPDPQYCDRDPPSGPQGVPRCNQEQGVPEAGYMTTQEGGEGGGNRNFTITLKPGRYRVNVQWRSKTQPFRITLTPRTRQSEAPPPPEPQPLYYGTCEAHHEHHAAPSLPRRLVHRLLSRPDGTGQDGAEKHLHHQHLQHRVGHNPAACGRKGQKRCWEGASPRHSHRKSRYRLAERKKNEGNELYKVKDYREALKLYTQAVDLCPDCAAYYSNRSACFMMLGKYKEALNDAREAVRLDKSFVKGYLRVAKCNIALGDATAAQSVLRQAGDLDPTNRAVREEAARAHNLTRCQEEADKATGKADYRTAIFHLDRALELAVGCRALKITKAEYLVFLHRYADAQEIVNEILQFESGNADAIYVRGMCLYYQDNPDAAFQHFQQVLRLAPDHHKARQVYKKAKQLKQKKEEGNEAFKRGSYQEAYNHYTEALAIDPLNKHTNAKLYFNRATVGSKINKVDEAVVDCTAAINLDEGYIKAYLRRAKCYQQLEKHEEAVRDYEKVTRLDRSQEHKRLLQEAKIQLKRSKRKDYYKILGVTKNASDDEIKKSYRKMALVHHPDRHANASDKDKQDHEVKFKEIGEAYSVLTDSKKRAMYDRGQDLNDPDGGFTHEEFDPNQIFQAFFGGGGGGGGGGGHGGYSFGGHGAGYPQGGGFPGGGFSQGGSFPGGFHFQFG